MKFRLIISLIIMLVSSIVHANEDKYNICFANGYFAGEDDKFMIGIATQIAVNKGVLNEPICKSAHKEAYEVGVKFSTTGKYDSEQELKIINYASEFREKVNRAIIKLIE